MDETWLLPAPVPAPSASAEVDAIVDSDDAEAGDAAATPLSRVKVFALYFAAAVVVFLIIGVIRTFG